MTAKLSALAALLLAALPRQDAGPKPLIVLVSGEYEYKSAESLPEFKKHLEANHPFRCVTLERAKGQDIPGLEAIEKADLAVLFIRRMTLPPDQLGRIRKHIDSGKPVVALRTSSHAFQNWLEFDPQVLGGNYKGHHGSKLVATARVEPKAADHPILRGVPGEFVTGGSNRAACQLFPQRNDSLRPRKTGRRNYHLRGFFLQGNRGAPKDNQRGQRHRVLGHCQLRLRSAHIDVDRPFLPLDWRN